MERLRLAVQVCLTLGAIATTGILIYAGGSLLTLLNPFAAWILLPYVILLIMGHFSKTRPEAIALLITSLLIIGFGTSVYIDGFFIHLDAQNALLFIFIPLYQLVLTVIVCIGILLVRLLRRKRNV